MAALRHRLTSYFAQEKVEDTSLSRPAPINRPVTDYCILGIRPAENPHSQFGQMVLQCGHRHSVPRRR